MGAHNPVLEYLNAIQRHWLVAVCAFAVGAMLTVWTVRSLPNVYQSTTLIMVEPQDVPQSFVKATVTTRVQERLNALSQEVLSRTRLEAIINDFNLFRDLRAQGVARERIVAAMRKKIQIQVFPRDNAFRISYEGHDPVVVQQVTARLAGLYIDENLRIREEHVSGTTEFLENELEKVKRELEAQEARIQAFKQEHMGELPEQREANMRALEGLRVQLQTVSMALSAAKERKLLLDKQAAEARSLQRAGPGVQAVNPRGRLRQLQAQLAELRGRYTDLHPDVITTRHQIDRLQADLPDSTGAERVPADPLLPPELAAALRGAVAEIMRLKAEKQNVERAIEAYQARVENGFTREQQLLGLTRDYGVTQKTYQSMLDKKLEAQLSQSLERRQKGERFRVLDPASLPQAPSRPNRAFLTLAGLGGSLALAIGLPILLWQLDTSFRLTDEVAACALPVLAVIPQLHTRDVAARRRRYRLRVVGLSAAGLIVGLSTVSFYARYLF
ncbi:MAG: XrtA system polysaccharide chain length determinant [Candidatus Binatia bacterium]